MRCIQRQCVLPARKFLGRSLGQTLNYPGWFPVIVADKSDNLAIIYDDVTVTMGAALTKTAVLGTGSKIDSARENGFRVLRTDYWVDFAGKTSGEGPIMVGASVAQDAPTVAQTINTDPQDSSDYGGNAQTKRPVWLLELLEQGETGGPSGRNLKGSFKPRWSAPEGENFDWWAYNMDTATLTTGLLVRIFAKHYGVWLRD